MHQVALWNLCSHCRTMQAPFARRAAGLFLLLALAIFTGAQTAHAGFVEDFVDPLVDRVKNATKAIDDVIDFPGERTRAALHPWSCNAPLTPYDWLTLPHLLLLRHS